jgi:hypothetical protein
VAVKGVLVGGDAGSGLVLEDAQRSGLLGSALLCASAWLFLLGWC